MKFPKWAVISWWIFLVVSVGIFLLGRYEQLQAGNPSWFDALAFMVWIVLALAPIFTEIEMFGLKFKQEVEKLKNDVINEVASIKMTLQNSTDWTSPVLLDAFQIPICKFSNSIGLI